MDHYNCLDQKEYYNFIKRLSPVAWTHINFLGKYEFLAPEEIIDIDNLLNQFPFENFTGEVQKTFFSK